MGIGASIFLIALGLILALAVDVNLSGIDLQLVGWILAVVLGLLLGPVALVLLLVGLLVFAIVAAVRSRGPT